MHIKIIYLVISLHTIILVCIYYCVYISIIYYFFYNHKISYVYVYSMHAYTFTFTFMHLADAFIQSDLQRIQVTVSTFLSALAFPGNRTHDLGVASAMLYQLSYRKVYIYIHGFIY